MRRRTFLIITCLVVGGIAGFYVTRSILKGPAPVGEPTPRPQGEGWVDLLDAQHVSGWKNTTDDKNIFEIKDGMVHLFGRSLYPLRYVGYAPERFGDFDCTSSSK